MRGLLTKDFLTIKNQGKSMILILAIGIIMIISGMNKTFVIGYLTFIASTFAISTLSYDEYDHGYPYIFILPIERKEYVVEKYLFSAMLSIAGWFGSGVIIVGVSAIRSLQPAVACILTGMLILAAGLGSFCCSKKIMERMEF